ncbi:MAG: SLBB domain-containing protein [Ignavibacteriaceae bacterium]
MKKYFIVFVFLFSVLVYGQFEDREKTERFMTAGAISITIGGDFIITGSYLALITERVDQFITRMYNETREQLLTQVVQQPELMERLQKEIESYSLRNITLKRSNGEELSLDLMKFRRTGDFSNNPYLRNDDVLIFQSSDLERNFFAISGAVNKPGKYHFRDGDKLSDAVEIAQGINKAYENVSKAEINRLSYDGEKNEVISVDINSNYALQRGDRIVVVASETQKKEFSVTVYGEVNMPGVIPVTRSSTTLKEVIERAGGVTEYAALNRAKLFTGNSFSLLVRKLYGVNVETQSEAVFKALTDVSERLVNIENAMMYRMSNVGFEDSVIFRMENELRVLTEGSSFNFSDINIDSSEASKYIVRDGDIIIIPQRKKTVYVYGQVANPGYIAFEEGRDMNYYLNKAGGLGEYAQDDDEYMLIKAGSREWIPYKDRKPAIEEGDYIYVPRISPPKPFAYYVDIASKSAAIISGIATILLVINQMKQN